MSEPTTTIELRAGVLRLALRPDLGGAIAGLWHEGVPVLRSIEPHTLHEACHSASYPLVPYSNRIALGRFPWAGKDWSARIAAEQGPHALHGVGLQRAWGVAETGPDRVVLTLAHPGDDLWPFAFEATQHVVLAESGVELTLAATNRASHPAPMGLGWHPFFPLRARSRIHAELDGRWDADATLLPVAHVSQHGIDADVAHLDFDNCFTGWQGEARIRDEKFSLAMSSSLRYLVVYTPRDKDYFAVEPVSHVNNALNMPDPAAQGVLTLEPGESASAWMKLELREVRG
jgi:aldose 1-epimerase